ncbi:AbrB/MazE/SpoVT family DNA-binding domain-containing protein [Halobaculum sp. MBLA0143]|uniref:AbrB/MazE/SpoVT family DNA-binding domain-containing protein n=1 Tax=Halobaculum sp. MBLA0143 TaxID=3079933 RepID=UPI0035260EBD
MSKHGQATIPKRFRDRLGLDTPGRVSFRETDDGETVVEPVPSPDEMRGFTARAGSETDGDKRATDLLKEKREQDVPDREAKFEDTDEQSAVGVRRGASDCARRRRTRCGVRRKTAQRG